MTGRELIVYILQNHLEDEPIVNDGKILGLLTVEEAARLQSFPVDGDGEKFIVDANRQQAYKQFGNSVNVEVIKKCAEQLFSN